MIDRYTHPEMGNIWTLENEFRTMLKVEILACEAMNKLGIVPDDALKDIQNKADFRLERIKEIEAVTNHDVIAFLKTLPIKIEDPIGTFEIFEKHPDHLCRTRYLQANFKKIAKKFNLEYPRVGTGFN